MPPSRALRLLARHSGRTSVQPGERLELTPSLLLLDGLSAGRMLAAADRRSGGLGVLEPQGALLPRCAIVESEPLPPADRQRLAALVLANGQAGACALDPLRMGCPGTVGTEEGWVDPDDLVAGATPDVGGVGGLGALVLRASPEQLAQLFERKGLPLVAPVVRRVRLTGRLPRWVGAVDVALHLARLLGASAPGCVLELEGQTVRQMTVDQRIALCEALARAGLVSLVAPDEATRVWLAARRAASPSPSDTDISESKRADQDEIQAAKIDSTPARRSRSPLVAGGPRVGSEAPDAKDPAAAGREPAADDLEPAADGPDLAADDPDLAAGDLALSAHDLDLAAEDLGLLAEVDGQFCAPGAPDAPTVHEVVISGPLVDLRQAAAALSERRLLPGLRLHVVPASRRSLMHALDEGLIQAFVRAGGILHAPGSRLPPVAPGERRLTTRPTSAAELLANPAVAMASAMCGRLVDPETMRREQRRSTSPP